MKLLALTLENFRQFYGKQTTIKFSPSAEKNVNVIFGANGAGKTTILNAFTWVLYRRTTPALSNPDKMICDRTLVEAKKGDVVEARVTLEFEHDGSRFIATRTRRERKIGPRLETEVLDDGSTLALQIVDSKGAARPSNNPDETVAQILPERLFDFFFFDGERIEHLTRESAYKEIDRAIKNLLGLEILERSIKHLEGKVQRSLDEELERHASKETQGVIQRFRALEAEIATKQGEHETARKNLESTRSQLSEVKSRLRAREESAKIQQKIDGLEAKSAEAIKAISDAEGRLAELVSRHGYLSLIDPLIHRSYSVLEDKRRKGEIPAGIKKQFVEDLLSRGICICGAPLKSGTDGHKQVAAWKARAGSSEVEIAATTVGVQFKAFVEIRKNFYSSLDGLMKEKQDNELIKKTLEEQLSQAKGTLDRKDSEAVHALVEKRNALEESMESLIRAEATVKRDLERMEIEKHDLAKLKAEAEAKSAEEAIVRKRIGVLLQAIDFFRALLSLRSSEIRKELDAGIKKVYQEISYKDYWPQITEDYKLVLRRGIKSGSEEVELDVEKGTGEAQILSLSFIGSIVSYARDLLKKSQKGTQHSDLGFTGGIYPIVMDSPFGALDENYRQAVASGIPMLADQIVTMVSKGQGLGIVLDNLKPRVGKKYVIVYYTTKKDAKAEKINLFGKEFPYIQISKDGTEWAQIMEA